MAVVLERIGETSQTSFSHASKIQRLAILPLGIINAKLMDGLGEPREIPLHQQAEVTRAVLQLGPQRLQRSEQAKKTKYSLGDRIYGPESSGKYIRIDLQWGEDLDGEPRVIVYTPQIELVVNIGESLSTERQRVAPEVSAFV